MRLIVTVAGVAALLGIAGLGSAADAPAGAKAASIHVTVPASAIVTIDGEKTTATSTERYFVTPPLDPTKKYSATVKAEFVRDGATISVVRKVTLKAGKVAHVNFFPKEAYSHLHDDHPAPVAPVIIGESNIDSLGWPTDWTGN